MNFVSYSVWGDNPDYLEGAVKNSFQVVEMYPIFSPIFFLAPNLYDDMDYLRLFHRNSLFVRCDDSYGMMWRFRVLEYKDLEVALFRDADSRISEREVAAVDAWMKSDKQFHIMRDHPAHVWPIMGGMWGAKKDGPIDIGVIAASLSLYDNKQYMRDQQVLAQLYQLNLAPHCLEHDDARRYNGIPFPAPEAKVEFGSFVGQRITHDNKVGRE